MRKNLGRKSLLVFAVMAFLLILMQAGSVSSAIQPIGDVSDGESVWWEVNGVGLLNITPEIAKVGETVLYQYANYTAFDLGLNITLRFKNNEGYVDVVGILREVQKPVTTYNISVEQLFNPANSSYYNLTTVNTSTTTITVKEWVNVPAISYVTGNDYYYTAQFFIGEQVSYKPKAKTYGGLIKYDTILHPSTLSPTQMIRVEIDPILNATAANITSNSDLNLTGKCKPNCAAFVDGKIVGAAGNKSNLTGWETWSDKELLNNPTWNLFNMSNFPYANNMESVRTDQGFLNLTTRTDTTSGTIWTSAMRKINISMPSSGIIVDFWVKPIGAAGNTWHPIFCFDFTYDKAANGTALAECNIPNSGAGVIAFYYESANNQYRLQKKDDGSMVTIASVEKQSGRDWEHWTVWINKTHAAAAVNFTEGGGTSLGVTAHNIAANGGGSGAISFDIYHGVIDDYRSALYDNISISNATDFRQPFNLTPAVLETNVMNSTITATTVKVSNQSSYYARGSGASFQVFDANHANLQSVTEGNNNAITSITGIGINATFTPNNIETATEFMSILVEWSPQTAPNNAPTVNVSVLNSTSSNSTASLASEQLFSNVNFSDADLHQEVNSTFKWFINNTNQSGVGNRTTELKAMIYKDAVLYLHLDEAGGTNGYADGSGFGNTGSPNGSAVNITGIIRGGVSFDGSGRDYINIPDSNSLDLTNNLTIAAWVKPARGQGGSGGTILTKGSFAYYTEIASSPQGRFQVYLTGTTNPGYHMTKQAIPNGTWSHVAWTYDGANVRLYVNGELDNTSATTGSITAGTGPLRIGSIKGLSAGYDFNGSIDEVAVYNHSLTPAEIKQLYLRTWYDYSPQLFLLQPYKDNATGLNSSDNEAPITVAGAKNVSGVWDGTYGVNLTPNGYINYSNNNSQNFNEREGTMEFWIKPEWNAVGDKDRTFFEGNRQNEFDFFKKGGGDIALYILNPLGYIFNYNVLSWLKGDWHHVAITWNNYTSNMTLHVDGSQVNNSATPFSLNLGGSFQLGGPNYNQFCNCTISEFRISRKALSAQEINHSFSKSRQFFQNEFLLNRSNYAKGDALKLEYSPKDSTGTAGAAQNSSNLNVHILKTADEAEGDTAIEVGINSSIPSATKYKEQQAYVRNLSNNQTLGTFDWVAAFGNQRWLFNYITTGESYVRAPNLTTAVYVLEITDKTSAAITDEVSKLINATKTQ